MLIPMAQSWWQWLRGWWNIGTLGGFSRLYDNISKIRARSDLRTAGAQLVETVPMCGAQLRTK